MANSRAIIHGSMLHIPLTNCGLLAAQQEPFKTLKCCCCFWRDRQTNRQRQRHTERKGEVGEKEEKNKQTNKNIQENGPSAEKGKDRKSNQTRQKNKSGDRKAESNDSPVIPDRGTTSDTPGRLRGGYSVEKELKIRKI